MKRTFPLGETIDNQVFPVGETTRVAKALGVAAPMMLDLAMLAVLAAAAMLARLTRRLAQRLAATGQEEGAGRERRQ